MSRVGKAPIILGEKVQAKIGPGNLVNLKGPRGELQVEIRPQVKVSLEGGKMILTRASDEKEVKSLHGMYRALLQNAVMGLEKGFTKTLELHGVGYRAAVNGNKLDLTLGYSHPISYPIPKGIEIKVEKQTVVSVTGASKELVGQVAAKIRSFRPPEPYLGKGVRYQGEKLRRKAGKSAGK
jgi:large subunit ribosomal protein L6